MTAEKKAAPAKAAAKDEVIATAGDTKLVMQTADPDAGPVQQAGEKGPPSSLETGKGSPTGASAGGDHDYDGRRGEAAESNGQTYSVQHHSDEGGLEVSYVNAESGDEAAQKVLAAAKYRGTSVRGVTPASDPDPNSMGGERDASVMIANAENPGSFINSLGTEANAKATEGLGKSDIKELGE